jgi:HK97 family phage portal protein
MNIAAAWRALWQQKDSAAGPIVAFAAGPGQPVWTPRNYEKLAKESYQKNIVAYRAIRLVVTSAASVPWGVQRRGVDLETHPLVTLMDRPNVLMAQGEFIENITAYYVIAGNSYIEAAGPERGVPAELWPLRPDRMRIVAGNSMIPARFVYSVGGKSQSWDVDQLTGKGPVLHLRTFNPTNDWYGLSPLEAAAMSVDIHNDALAWNKVLVQNDARPPGVLTYEPKDGPDVLSDDQRTRIIEELEQKYAGKESARRPLLLEGGLKWQQLGMSPKDMDFVEAKNTTSTDIAQAFGVPPQLIGIPGSQTFANYAEARLAFWEDTVIPLLYGLRDEFNGWLSPMFGDDIRLACDLDDVPALAERRKQHFDMIREADWLTIDEKREAMGLKPIDGGDVLLVPATMLPLTAAGEIDEDPEEEAEKELGPLTYKLFIRRDGQNRERELAIQLRLTSAFERRFAPRIARLIDARAKAAAQTVADGAGVAGIDIALNGHVEELTRELVGHYRVVMEAFGKRVLDAGKSLPGASETKDAESEFTRRITRWIEQWASAKVVDISTTTRNRINDALRAGEIAGEPLAAIAKRIREATGGAIARARGLVIARTETHSASIAAGDEALSSIGLDDIEREWIAAEDGRTRPSHADADEQRRKQGEAFDVGSAKLRAPGDPAGPAEEIVNCRCALAGVVD